MKTKWRVGQWSPYNTWLQVYYLCTEGFNLEILPCGFAMQHQILINVIIYIAYMLNLPLNTQTPHHHSQRAGKWSLILAHDSRPIYRAPTYIAVPLLGPHQPRYMESTLYFVLTDVSYIASIGYAFSSYNEYYCINGKMYKTDLYMEIEGNKIMKLSHHILKMFNNM